MQTNQDTCISLGSPLGRGILDVVRNTSDTGFTIYTSVRHENGYQDYHLNCPVLTIGRALILKKEIETKGTINLKHWRPVNGN